MTKLTLTDIQREVLELLRDGGVMVVDERNMASVGGRNVSSQTRYSLVNRKLVKRLDPGRATAARGNGLVISERGLEVLSAQPPTKKRPRVTSADKDPTERQLAYAERLGVVVPAGASRADISKLIQAKLDDREAATEPETVLVAEVDVGELTETKDSDEPSRVGTRGGCLSLIALAWMVALALAAAAW